MSVLEIRRPSPSGTIAEALRARILAGEYTPGMPLVPGALPEAGGAPGPVVRAALAELERDGLVVHSLHRGLEVAQLSQDDVRDLYAARRVFEQAGLDALLARRPVDVSWLGAAADRMGEASVAGDRRAIVEADLAFHLALVAAAGSHRLTRAAQGALMELRLVLATADRLADDLPAVVADHQYLVEVFRAGHAREAASALADHLARAEVAARTAAAEAVGTVTA